MIKYIYKFSVLILVVIVGFGFIRYYKVNEYALATEDDTKVKCSEFGEGAKKYKSECWACPAGFKRSPLHIVGNPDNEKHCRQKDNKYIDALYHSKPTGLLKTKCKTKDVWYKNKKCWTCPDGYKPARIKESDDKMAQCKPDNKYTYKPATKLGEVKCSDGAWSPLLSKKCYSCPEGFNHNKALRGTFNFNPSKDPKACKRKVSLMDSLLEST